MRQAKLVVMYSLEYYKFKFRKCSLVADKRLRSGLKTHKHIAPSCLLRLLCFLNFSLLLARVHLYIIRCLPMLPVSPPLIFPPLLRAAPSPRRPFSTLPLLRADPSPRRPFSTPPLLRAAPRAAFVPLRPLRSAIRPIRLIRFQKKFIVVQKKFLGDSCANTPSKLSPALYKPHAKVSAIPLKSRKTQIFSNFLSQSLARFRKSPYFCTR